MTLRAHARQFARFTLVGVVFYVLAVACNGLLIDRMGANAYYASAGSITVLFVLKYFAYLWLDAINVGFLRFTLANLGVTLAATLVVGLLVDKIGVRGWLATAGVLGAGVILRYLVLLRAGVIRNGHPNPTERTPDDDPRN